MLFFCSPVSARFFNQVPRNLIKRTFALHSSKGSCEFWLSVFQHCYLLFPYRFWTVDVYFFTLSLLVMLLRTLSRLIGRVFISLISCSFCNPFFSFHLTVQFTLSFEFYDGKTQGYWLFLLWNCNYCLIFSNCN